MDSAISLKTGDTILASEADYETTRKLILICPECKEPVHLTKRKSPNLVSFFSHPEHKGEPTKLECSLRVLSLWDQPYKNIGPWKSKGQLIAKIQSELISFFAAQFGEQKETIIIYLKQKIHEKMVLGPMHKSLIDALCKTEPSEIFRIIREISTLNNDQGRVLTGHYKSVVECLQGRHLHAANLGLLWCAFVVANTLHDIHGTKNEPLFGAMCGAISSDFAIDPNLFKKALNLKKPSLKSSDITFYRSVAICRRLLIRLLINWTNPSSLKNTNFIFINMWPELIEKNSSVTSYEPPPAFRTLKERMEWFSRD